MVRNNDLPTEDEQIHWFVMRDLKRPNAKRPAYKQLQEMGFGVFTPVKWRLVIRQGKCSRERVPVIPDLLFVHTTRDRLDPVVDKIPTLQYRYKKGCGYCSPMTVPEAEMERFIHAVSVSDELKYYLPRELTPTMYGRTVRIIGGTLDGYEGKLLTVRGSRVKRLLVELPGFFFVGVKVEPEYIQLL